MAGGRGGWMKMNGAGWIFVHSLAYPFSSDDISILIFQKVIKKYNKTFNKDIYFKLRKCCAKFCAGLARHFLLSSFCFNEREIFSTQSNGNFEW